MQESKKETVVTRLGNPGEDASSIFWINSASRLKEMDVAKLSVFTDHAKWQYALKYFHTKHVLIMSVFFYRYAKHYLENNVEKRTLLKVFGIRIDIIVHSLVGNNIYYHFRLLTICVFFFLMKSNLCLTG